MYITQFMAESKGNERAGGIAAGKRMRLSADFGYAIFRKSNCNIMTPIIIS
jgi:hypothetical protein